MRRFILTGIAALVVALALSSVASAGVTGKAAAFKFSGKTSQGGGVAIVLSSNLKRMNLAFDWQVTCQSGGSFKESTEIDNIRTVLQNRSVKYISEPGAYKLNDIGQPGFTANITAKSTGKIRARSGNGSGTFEVDADVFNSAGQQVDKCTTGASPITFRVKVK